MLGHSSSLKRDGLFMRAVSFAALVFLGAGCANYNPKSTTQTAQISVSAQSLNFQNVVVGQTSTQKLTISNTGNAILAISSLSLSSKEFTISGPALPSSIPANGSASYTLTFAPTSAGTWTATLDIASNAANALGAIDLQGNGEKAFVDLVITPTVLSFGKVTLKTSSTQNVTLQNSGDISMTLQGVTVAGAGFGYSDLSPGYSLGPGQKVTFQVWFDPKVTGSASGTLSILSANLSSPGTLDLSGDGVASTSSSPTPPAPTASTVLLNWNASTSQVVSYNVYRSQTSGGSYSLMSSTSSLTYTDSSVTAGSTYYYVVTAVNSAGVESGYSNQVSAAIPAS